MRSKRGREHAIKFLMKLLPKMKFEDDEEEDEEQSDNSSNLSDDDDDDAKNP